MASIQCTEAEAAAFFEMTTAAFRKTIATYPAAREAWIGGREMGKVSLRRKQFNLASTSAAMAKFLGQQYLGQRDVQSHEHSGPAGGPIDFQPEKLSKDERAGLRQLLERARAERGTG